MRVASAGIHISLSHKAANTALPRRPRISSCPVPHAPNVAPACVHVRAQGPVGTLALLDGSSMVNNSASNAGGAIYIWSGLDRLLVSGGSRLSDNACVDDSGGAVAVEGPLRSAVLEGGSAMNGNSGWQGGVRRCRVAVVVVAVVVVVVVVVVSCGSCEERQLRVDRSARDVHMSCCMVKV